MMRFATVLALLVAVTMVESHKISYGYKVCPDHYHKHDMPIYYAHEEYCTKFYQCAEGVPKEMDCAPGTVFNNVLNVCVNPGSKEDICTPFYYQRECSGGATHLVPHPTACHLYYNCSDVRDHFHSNPLGFYGRLCPYPYQFDIHKRACVPFEHATCGIGRIPSTWECDYVAHVCPHGKCFPCALHYPSCVGKEDGLWFHQHKLWSPYFVSCHKHRSQHGEEHCPKHKLSGTQMVFHPDKRQCVCLWEVPRKHGGYEPSCEGKASGIYVVEDTPTVSFTCPGKQLYWCNPPLFVDNHISRCTPF